VHRIGGVLLIAALALLAFTSGRAQAESSGFEDGFKTPSRNIVCAAGGGSIRCDIRSGVRPLPPHPSWCSVDWGQGVQLSRRGRARYVFAGDTVLGQNVPVLRYGFTWRGGGITCISRSTGLTCRNASGRGFFMSRARTRLF
jgi:hypothetical protein